MTDAPYEPEEGHLVWIDFDPRTGGEQSGRRPAVVVSPRAFWVASRFLIVCPVTSRVRPFAASVILPEGLPVSGEVLTSHIRSIDTLARPVVFAGAALPSPLLDELREKIAVLIGYRA